MLIEEVGGKHPPRSHNSLIIIQKKKPIFHTSRKELRAFYLRW